MYMTIDDHVNWYMDDCVDYIRKESGKDQINLLGVCQGGTFSTMYAALHPEKVKNLVTMVVPIDFSTNDGLLFRWSRDMNIDSLIEAYDGVVPGDVMNVAYLILKPLTLTLDKYVGMTDKWTDPTYLANFMRMEKWVFDSPAQVGATLSQFINDLYKGNKLIKGELELGGKKVDLNNITMPVLCACAEYDHLVPLSASRPFIDAIPSDDKQFISFATGHIGMYTSSKSQKNIAPQIIEWIKARSK
jgi:polyhydroxyalkanoate synthase